MLKVMISGWAAPVVGTTVFPESVAVKIAFSGAVTVISHFVVTDFPLESLTVNLSVELPVRV